MSETEERQFTSGTEPVNKPVEEIDSSVKPRCRKRRHSSHEGKSPGKKRFYVFLEITEAATLKLTIRERVDRIVQLLSAV